MLLKIEYLTGKLGRITTFQEWISSFRLPNSTVDTVQIHQLQMAYEIEQDRILFRVSFTQKDEPLQEIRAWLTRRIVKNLWKGLIKALETQVTLDQPQAAHAKAEIVQMAYQASNQKNIEEGNFSTPFDENAQSYCVIGAEPILITKAHLKVTPNRPLSIKFAPNKGYEFEVTFKPEVLHGFCTLLQQSVKAAEWDMELILPGTMPDTSGRMLN